MMTRQEVFRTTQRLIDFHSNNLEHLIQSLFVVIGEEDSTKLIEKLNEYHDFDINKFYEEKEA